jgi:hypothetical protein
MGFLENEDVPLLDWFENDLEFEQFTLVQTKKIKKIKANFYWKI